MGKGDSSDVYRYSISDINGREFTATIQPTGAGGIELPYGGLETLFLMIVWENIEFNIRYRSELSDVGINVAEVKNGISRWANKIRTTLSSKQSDNYNYFAEWKKLPQEEREPYEQEYLKETIQQDRKWYKTMEDKEYPGLAELSVDDICSSRLRHLTFMYVQSVTLLDSQGYTEEELQKKKKQKKKKKKQDDDTQDYIKGTYRVVMTDPLWINQLKENADGTTSYEQIMTIPQWNKVLHCRFPRAFRLRVIILLMMRLPRHAGNIIHRLPEPMFYHVIEKLARVSYDEDVVPAWEKKRNIPPVEYKAPSRELQAEIIKLRQGMEQDAGSISF